jgi:hypothetical protein
MPAKSIADAFMDTLVQHVTDRVLETLQVRVQPLQAPAGPEPEPAAPEEAPE